VEAYSYPDAVAALEAAIRFGIHPSLDTTRVLLAALGQPHRAFRAVQVAGTNGKGSTTRMCAAILGEHGIRTGTFTSPHLVDYREQVQVAGAYVGDKIFAAGVCEVLNAVRRSAHLLVEAPTQFELLSVAAVWMLHEAGVEWAVLETGMGGRWDSTTACEAEVAVVTSVGLDHTAFLGPTLEDIAADKAHVIRAGVPCVLGPGTAEVDAVFSARAEAVGSALARVRLSDDGPGERPHEVADVLVTVVHECTDPGDATVIDVRTPYAAYARVRVNGPRYQAENAGCAIAAAEIALGGPLKDGAVRQALGDLHMEGRFEVLARDPWVITDVAHNEAGARALAHALAGIDRGRSMTVVLGMLSDKDVHAVVRALEPVVRRFVTVGLPGPRGLAGDALAELVREETGAEPTRCSDVASALALVRTAGEACVVTGSHVTVAAACEAMRSP